MNVWEQVDRTGAYVSYSWMADVGFRAGKTLLEPLGWRWVRGEPGSWVTDDRTTAARLLGALGKPAKSNGTHEIYNVVGMLT